MIFLSNLDEKCFLLLRFLTKIRNPERIRQNWQGPNENHGFVKEKFRELDSDQIEGAEFEFLGLETRFKRNKSRDKNLEVRF